MLSISTALKGANSAGYYLKGENVGYYLDPESEAGRWMGRGAVELGLTGVVDPMMLLHLWAGYSPDGRDELVQNAGDEDRDCAWDLTFSDPKSVSVLWGLGTPEIREAIDRARDAALHETLGWLADQAGLSRRGRGGKTMEEAGLVFAVFDHRLSRSLEPNTHAHCLLLNVGVREDGTTGALVTQKIFDLKMEAGERYRNSLERHLGHELPIVTEKRDIGFHILGVSGELCDRLSSRRREIAAALEARGLSGAVAAKIATLDTRREKRREPLEELVGFWRREAEQLGWTPEEVFREWRRQAKEHGAQQEEPDHRSQERTTTESHEPNWQYGRKDSGKERNDHAQGEETRHEGQDSKEQNEWDQKGREQRRRQEENPRQDRPRWGQGFVQVEWRHIAPNAPAWSPVRNWKLPRLVLGNQNRSRWGRTVWRKRLGNVVLSYQERFLFPNAPRWSPFHRVSLRAFRVQTVAQERKNRRYRRRMDGYREEAKRRKRQRENLRRERSRRNNARSKGMEHGH
jgi:conjugative relaxase-like TrwC/TraI family protein